MTIEFFEEPRDDGCLVVRWEASTTREWQTTLNAIKGMIPKGYRAFDSQTKAWVISPSHIETYYSIKAAILGQDNEEILHTWDEQVNEQALASLLEQNLCSLPKTMRRRAIFAIKSALGIIDVPVEFSIARDAFGAWNEEEGVWCYEDGRYSKYSPSEWDDKAITRAYKRLQKAISEIPEALEMLDEEREEYWKQKLRTKLLEEANYQCYVCGHRPRDLRRLHMHRVTPGNKGGQYIEGNIAILCAKCHWKLEGLGWDAIHVARRANLREDW